MKNIIKSIGLLALLTISQVGFSQKPITHILVDPLKFGNQAFNIGAQIQFNQMPYIALYGSIAQESKTLSMLQIQSKTQSFEVRFFPFSQQRKGSLSGCEQSNFKRKTNTIDAPILRGLYLSSGMLFESMVMDTSTTIKSEISANAGSLTAKTRAFTLALGYQIHISAFTFGLNYQVAFRKTTLDGNSEILKNTVYLEQLQTNRTNLNNTLRVEIGIHF
jgi:hypothetical protein